jgi:hypothetical protein
MNQLSTIDLQEKRGVLTIATGERYLRQAINMAKSCRLHNSGLPLAIVTDRPRTSVPSVFDIVIPIDPGNGAALRQKLCIDIYSPFLETLFVDSDCLIAGNLDEDFRKLGIHLVGVAGTMESMGHWYTDVETLCAHIGKPAIPRFNTGLIYVRQCNVSSKILSTARQMMDRSADFGIPNTHGQPPDEPALSLAMAMHNLEPVPGKFEIMPTHISDGFEDMDLDVVRGTCWYRVAGRVYYPRVAHFVAWRWQLSVYRREAFKLRLVRAKGPLSNALSTLIDWMYFGRNGLRSAYWCLIRLKCSNVTPDVA